MKTQDNRSKNRWILYDGPAERVTGQRVGTRVILSTVDPNWFAKAMRLAVVTRVRIEIEATITDARTARYVHMTPAAGRFAPS
jgi:hypothetical protein